MSRDNRYRKIHFRGIKEVSLSYWREREKKKKKRPFRREHSAASPTPVHTFHIHCSWGANTALKQKTSIVSKCFYQIRNIQNSTLHRTFKCNSIQHLASQGLWNDLYWKRQDCRNLLDCLLINRWSSRQPIGTGTPSWLLCFALFLHAEQIYLFWKLKWGQN